MFIIKSKKKIIRNLSLLSIFVFLILISCDSYHKIAIKNERSDDVYLYLGIFDDIETEIKNEDLALDTLAKKYVLLKSKQLVFIGSAINKMKDYDLHADTLIVLSRKLDTIESITNKKILFNRFERKSDGRYCFIIQ